MKETKYNTLSEQLFAPHLAHKDVSTLLNTEYNADKDDSAWYRIFNSVEWGWFGVHLIQQEEILSLIAASKATRTHEKWLDTVVGYQEGAWVYEWVRFGMTYQKEALLIENALNDQTSEQVHKERAEIADEQIKKERLFQLWTTAMRYYTIASYPNLRGDQDAGQAILLAHNAHKQMIHYAPFVYKAIELIANKQKIKGHLYLPHTEHPVPIFFYCCDLDQRYTQLLPLYKEHLLALNVGFFIMDPPSIGDNSEWKIENNIAEMYEFMLQHLSSLSWVDERNIIVGGSRLGGNVAIRLAYTHGTTLKAAISINGYLHEAFYRKNYPEHKMKYDLYTSAFGMQSILPTLLKSKLQNWSLKTQGLLGHSKIRIPTLVLRSKNHPYSSLADDKLCEQCCVEGTQIQIDSKTTYQGYDGIMKHLLTYLQTHFTFDY